MGFPIQWPTKPSHLLNQCLIPKQWIEEGMEIQTVPQKPKEPTTSEIVAPLLHQEMLGLSAIWDKWAES